MSIRKICSCLAIIVLIALGVLSGAVIAALPEETSKLQNTPNPARAIPEDNLAYPVLIILPKGTGSGFYLDTPTTQYLVTANHVITDDASLIDPATKKYKADAAFKAISYSSNASNTTPNVLSVNLHDLQSGGYLRADPANDVAVMTIGTLPKMPSTPQPVSPVNGVIWIQTFGTVGVSIDAVKTLDRVIVGNDVIMYGYPTSLGLKKLPQINPLRPLLRKGIVAGKDLQKHSIVLDCPAYFGDSGGPVFEIDREAFSANFRLIGMVDQYVPFVSTDARTFVMQTNSGYSIASPMDAVLELIK
jgi:hypothetical protein